MTEPHTANDDRRASRYARGRISGVCIAQARVNGFPFTSSLRNSRSRENRSWASNSQRLGYAGQPHGGQAAATCVRVDREFSMTHPVAERAMPLVNAQPHSEEEGQMAYGIVHFFAGGTKEQYEASLAAHHHDRTTLPKGQVYHAAGPSAGGGPSLPSTTPRQAGNVSGMTF